MAACAGGDGSGDPPAPVVCESVVTAFEPASNAMDVDVAVLVTVSFDAAIPEGGTWALELTDVDGTGVPGTATLSEDRTSASFTPDGDLSHETVYTITATGCDDTQSANFLTVPAPVDASLLEGNTFGIREGDLQISEPAGAGALLALIPGGLFGTLAVQLTDFDAGSETFAGVGAVIDRDTDEIFCDQLVNTDVDYSANPFVSFGPDDLVIEIAPGQTLQLEDLTVSGRVSADGQSLLEPVVSLLVASEAIPSPIPLPACPDIPEDSLFTPTCVKCDSSTDSDECLLFEGTVDEAVTIARDIVQECAG